MSALELRLSDDAQRDLAEAYGWYESERPGLGKELVADFDQSAIRPVEIPRSCRPEGRGVRSFKLSRFPYRAYFRLQGDELRVIAVVHDSRDPAIWKSRANRT